VDLCLNRSSRTYWFAVNFIRCCTFLASVIVSTACDDKGRHEWPGRCG